MRHTIVTFEVLRDKRTDAVVDNPTAYDWTLEGLSMNERYIKLKSVVLDDCKDFNEAFDKACEAGACPWRHIEIDTWQEKAV